jgi:hypothetical protein
MLNDSLCPLGDRREQLLVAYLYDDGEPRDRDAFVSHLAACPVCVAEVDTLSHVRADLATWAPPEQAVGVGGEAPRSGPRLAAPGPIAAPAPAAVRSLPAWLQVAAAVVFFAAALGAANLDVSYSNGSVSVRTGWLHERTQAAPATQAADSAPDAPWRSELAALEQQLRAEMTRPASTEPADTDADAILSRARALVVESEKRQQRELALRVAEVAREAQLLRQADLVRIDRSLGLIQSRTGVEVMRTQRQLNSLAQRVSQRP